MYDTEDLDAVIIATPDHARVRAAILACMKGLDIYAEKPLSRVLNGQNRRFAQRLTGHGHASGRPV